MTQKIADGGSRILPRLLRRNDAAHYVGVSPSHFDTLVKDGVFPHPKVVRNIRAWDRSDLDDVVSDLPYSNAAVRDTSWD